MKKKYRVDFDSLSANYTVKEYNVKRKDWEYIAEFVYRSDAIKFKKMKESEQ